MKLIKTKIIIFFILLFGFSILSSPVLAFMEWPNSPVGTSLTEDSKLTTLIQYLYEWGITLGGLAVFISLIIAGIQYLSSFGNPVSMKNAMDRIKSAFLGLILLLSSWLILNTINPDLTSFSPLTIPVDGGNLGLCETNLDCEKFGEYYTCKETDIKSNCKTDDDCSAKHDDSYTCIKTETDSFCRSADKFCVVDFESQFKIVPCDHAIVNGRAIPVEAGCSTGIPLKAGETFTVGAYPNRCMGYLELYPGGFFSTCSGDKQTILLHGGETTTEEVPTDMNIKGMKTTEIKTGL